MIKLLNELIKQKLTIKNMGKETSLTKAVIYFKHLTGPRTFYSYQRHDKLGKQVGINKLLIMILSAHPFNTAIIYDNKETIVDKSSGEIKNVELHKFVNNKQHF